MASWQIDQGQSQLSHTLPGGRGQGRSVVGWPPSQGSPPVGAALKAQQQCPVVVATAISPWFLSFSLRPRHHAGSGDSRGGVGQCPSSSQGDPPRQYKDTQCLWSWPRPHKGDAVGGQGTNSWQSKEQRLSGRTADSGGNSEIGCEGCCGGWDGVQIGCVQCQPALPGWRPPLLFFGLQ